MTRGFVYVFAVLGASRRVLSWRLSNMLTTDFCLDAVQEAINRAGTPDIFHTDQRCQFTSLEFTGLLKDHGIQISMDGTGCRRGNVFVERLWKSVTYEEVYLLPARPSAPPNRAWSDTLTFYSRAGHTGRLTGTRRMECTSTTCPHGDKPCRRNTAGLH